MNNHQKYSQARNAYRANHDQGQVIGGWGEAKLVKYHDGKLELRGGTRDEQTAVKEWISLFWHEAVVSYSPGVKA